MVQSVQAAPVIMAENQKPIVDAAPAPIPATKQDSGFHPMKGLAHQVKEIFHHDDTPPTTDTARGLDLEAEIGKRELVPTDRTPLLELLN